MLNMTMISRLDTNYLGYELKSPCSIVYWFVAAMLHLQDFDRI